MWHLAISTILLVGAGAATIPSNDASSLLDMVNRERVNKELPKLRLDKKLGEAAQAHSANMARQDKMAHELDGKAPGDRVRAAGYQYMLVGENIAYGQRTSLQEIFGMWMKSQPHRENILGKSYEEIGIGIASGTEGKVYYTLVFATPRK